MTRPYLIGLGNTIITGHYALVGTVTLQWVVIVRNFLITDKTGGLLEANICSPTSFKS